MVSRHARTAAPLDVLLLAGTTDTARAAAQDEGEAPTQDLTQLSLEELMEIPVETVYGASLALQPTVEAPSSVTIVTAREIEAQGWRTLADLLRGVRSFYVTDDRTYEHLGVRGFNPIGDFNSRVLLLIDGHRINNAVYDSAPIGLELPLDVDLIERVEIIRGPGSSLYGSNAFFGVISIVTRSGKLAGLELSAEAGSFGNLRGRASWGGKVGPGIDVLVSGTAFDREGDQLFYPEFSTTPSNGHTSGTDFERGYSFFSSASWQAWRLEAAYVSREKGLPTGSYGTVFDDDDNRSLDAQGYVDLSCDQRLSDEWRLGARLYYDHYYYRGTYVYDATATGGPPDQESDDRATGDAWGTELTLASTAIERHRITSGVELRHDLRRDQSYEDPTAVFLDDERDAIHFGAFVQDDVQLAPRFVLNAGLRWDHYHTFGGMLNPRIGLIWNPDAASAWKLLYGTAFRAPNAYELYYSDGNMTQKASPDLEPETIQSFELVHERHFGPRWRASASLFHNDIDDLILLTTDPSDGLLVFRNASRATAEGLELEAERVFDQGLRLLGSYSLQRVEDDATGDRVPNSPAHLVKLAVETRVFCEWLLAGVEYQWTSSRETLAGNDLASYGVLNATLRTHGIGGGVQFSASVFNLFNEEYFDPGGPEHVQDRIEQDGRTFLARAIWRF